MESQRIIVHRLILFLLGFTSMSTQVILIRESLAVFHGNELVIGLFLGIWMILTASGSFLAIQSSKFKVQSFTQPLRLHTYLLILMSLLPLATLFLLVTIRFALVPSGIMPGLLQTALVILLSLLPFCMVSGMLFPMLVQNLSAFKSKNLLHEGYALDSAGSILGGLIFSLVFIFTLPPFESLVLLTSFCLLFIFILSVVSKKPLPAVISLVIGILVFILPFKPGIVRYLDHKQFNKQEVIEIKSSPFGMLAVSRLGEEIFIYDNGNPVSLNDNAFNREESVHYAMLLHHSPKKVLLVSGGTSGIISEILKYSVEKVDYIEPNPWLISMVDKYRPFPEDQRVSYIYQDPRIFLRKNEEKYDVILVNTPEPNSAELNRLYTVEFYNLLKEKLNSGGILSVSIPSAGNYMSETSRQVHSVNYNTMKTLFKHIRIIPGWKDYFLSSDSSLDKSIFYKYPAIGFTNLYVNPSYINENLLKMRSDLIMKDLLPDEPLNSDLRPYVFSLYLRYWLEQFKMNQYTMPLILLFMMILSLVFLGPLNLGLFTGGFTASGLEFILLIWFQVMYGSVYLMTGVIFALFMAGLVVGSLLSGISIKNHTFKGFLTIQGVFACFALLVATLMIMVPSGTHDLFMVSLIFELVLITGLLMGAQFASSSRLRTSSVIKSSGESFSADLLGSALGIIFVSIYMVPLLGLPRTALVLAGLNVAVMGIVFMKGRYTTQRN
jgi:spermidine synthase